MERQSRKSGTDHFVYFVSHRFVLMLSLLPEFDTHSTCIHCSHHQTEICRRENQDVQAKLIPRSQMNQRSGEPRVYKSKYRITYLTPSRNNLSPQHKILTFEKITRHKTTP